MARNAGVHICLLPPNTTWWLQPLDEGVFGHVKRLVRVYFSHRTEQIARNHQIAVITKCCKPAFAPAIIKEAWRRTGLCPTDRKQWPPEHFRAPIVSNINEDCKDERESAEETLPLPPAPESVTACWTDRPAMSVILTVPREPFDHRGAAVSLRAHRSLHLLQGVGLAIGDTNECRGGDSGGECVLGCQW